MTSVHGDLIAQQFNVRTTTNVPCIVYIGHKHRMSRTCYFGYEGVNHHRVSFLNGSNLQSLMRSKLNMSLIQPGQSSYFVYDSNRKSFSPTWSSNKMLKHKQLLLYTDMSHVIRPYTAEISDLTSKPLKAQHIYHYCVHPLFRMNTIVVRLSPETTIYDST